MYTKASIHLCYIPKVLVGRRDDWEGHAATRTIPTPNRPRKPGRPRPTLRRCYSSCRSHRLFIGAVVGRSVLLVVSDGIGGGFAGGEVGSRHALLAVGVPRRGRTVRVRGLHGRFVGGGQLLRRHLFVRRCGIRRGWLRHRRVRLEDRNFEIGLVVEAARLGGHLKDPGDPIALLLEGGGRRVIGQIERDRHFYAVVRSRS